MKAISIRVFGKVQGVYFRASTREKANELGLCGWCKDEPEGTVFIHAEGSEEALSLLLAWCHQGPQWSSVTEVKHESTEVEGLNGFGIRR